jgi:hypothetical protein
MPDDATHLSQGQHVYFYGAFVYYDVFKERHFTTTCGFYSPSSSPDPLGLFVCSSAKASDVN